MLRTFDLTTPESETNRGKLASQAKPTQRNKACFLDATRKFSTVRRFVTSDVSGSQRRELKTLKRLVPASKFVPEGTCR